MTNQTKNQDKKLTSELEKEAKNKKTFFLALWLLNAVTTFVFGMEYIDGLYAGVLAPLRMGAYGLMVFSQVLGGASALLVLDVAYKKWAQIRKTATTNTQLRAAKIAGNVSFYMSLLFSAIIFVTKSFSGLVSAELIETLDMVGAGSFVGVVIMHLVCWRTFAEGGAAEIEFSDRLKFRADNHTEKSAIKRTAQTESLLEAREKMNVLKSVIADKQSNLIVAEMLNDLLGEGAENDLIIEGEAIPQAPPKRGFGFNHPTNSAENNTPTNSAEPRTYSKTCAICSNGFESQRRNARYCDETCKQSAYRARSSK